MTEEGRYEARQPIRFQDSTIAVESLKTIKGLNQEARSSVPKEQGVRRPTIGQNPSACRRGPRGVPLSGRQDPLFQRPER